ncbi:ribonuclease H1 domain-containing protein [Psychroflexus maritimus]|uniref:Ribonuclease H n=1 Tax=Psychroflexus maritimus TaxID=2714865 RepID=A0A967AEG0_9FLAO|nr:ribonuclease H family protein [Psychroflexus maritimus]NGZ90581.1 ribonuclease H [Psychroflexus maritimus]
MSKKKKFYVVWEGYEMGVFDNWTSCQQAIKNYKNAKYKSFKTETEAKAAFQLGFYNFIQQQKENQAKSLQQINLKSIAVDAACSGNPGLMEYQGVVTKDKRLLFKKGPFADGTNNIGEFLALVHALAFLKEKKSDLPIYSDSKIAMAWVKNKKCKSKLKPTENNKILFELIQRAELWLKKNTYKNPILKWETKNWGEIPADFGRK